MMTYQDYLNTFIGRSGGSEAGSSDPMDYVLSEADWEALTQEQQFTNTNMGDQFAITPDDPRYRDLAVKTGAEPGRNLRVVHGTIPAEINGVRPFVDPSKVVQQDGYYVYADNNETPEYQASRDQGLGEKFALAALAMVGGLGAAGALSGGISAAGNLAAAPGMGFGTAGMGGAAEGIFGALGAGAGAGAGPMDAVSAAEWFGGEGAATNPSSGLFSGTGAPAPYGTNALDAAEWFGGPDAATNPGSLFGNTPPPPAPYGWDATEAAEWFGGEGAATNPGPGLFGSEVAAPGLWEQLLNFDPSQLTRALPGIASALGGGAKPPSGGGGGGGYGGGFGSAGGGSGSRGGGRASAAEANPYSRQKLTEVGQLAQYLRGVA